ncbi:78_t:CDS:2 [Scutellospora calospora]|uniref:78_t:CDS:1 n=1 Tax=Scutellospora calospora TaxID=85575 RepID=A0ACA9L3Q3_9GLOM|nr:78_t:CDS:2 [Scutellospora calospora]
MYKQNNTTVNECKLIIEANEAMCCEFISSFLLYEQEEANSDEAFKTEDYDYLYEIVSTGIDWHFIMFISEEIFCTSNSEYQIDLTKKVLKGNQKNLRENIKQVISIVVGLLKDRVTVCDEPESKRCCMQEKITKK